MPTKIVTVRRWEVVVAFVAVTALFAVGLWLQTSQDNKTRHLAVRADVQAQQIAQQVRDIRRLRAEQLSQLHAADVKNCSRVHQVVKSVRGIIVRALAQERSTPTFPGLTPAQAQALRRAQRVSVRSLKRSLGDLHAADCVAVEPLPGVPPAP